VTKYLNLLIEKKPTAFQEFLQIKYSEDQIEKGQKKKKIGLEDFEILKLIGEGCMGKVSFFIFIFILFFIFSKPKKKKRSF